MIVLVLLTIGAFFWKPAEPRVALGIVGGGVLIGLSDWALRGGWRRGGFGRNPEQLRRFRASEVFHKACYTRRRRLRYDLLIGVTAPAVAAAAEAIQAARN